MNEYELIMRFLCSFFSGALLCLGGSFCQVYTQNEMASPSTLGFSGLVVLQVIIFHLLKTIFHWSFPLEYGALVLSFLFLVVLLLLTKSKRMSFTKMKEHLILLGICFNLLVGSFFSILYFLFLTKALDFPSYLWFGSFKFVNLEMTIISGFFCLLALLYASRFSSKMQLLVYGAEYCQNLKMEPLKFVGPVICLSYVSMAITTCFFGVFSFLGLLFPHLLRHFSFFSRNLKRELTIGPLVSGSIFAIIDQFTYFFPLNGAELPVGMITSILGCSLFIVLLLKKKTNS